VKENDFTGLEQSQMSSCANLFFICFHLIFRHWHFIDLCFYFSHSGLRAFYRHMCNYKSPTVLSFCCQSPSIFSSVSCSICYPYLIYDLWSGKHEHKCEFKKHENFSPFMSTQENVLRPFYQLLVGPWM